MEPCDPCPACRGDGRPIAIARAVGPYEGRLRDIVHALKYDGRRTLAGPLAVLLRDAGRDVLENADAAVPVPLHWARRHQRGFNQSALLCERLGIPILHALRRGRRTRPQVDLPAGERQRNVAGAFAVARRFGGLPARLRLRAPIALRGSTLVLVDDVSTTGSTLDACARVLVAAGAREVRALTVARVAARSR